VDAKITMKSPTPSSSSPPRRKLISISAVSTATPLLIGLADDGTVWRLPLSAGYEWVQLPDVPQPDRGAA
jgi:hypothetical protein